MRSEAQKRAIKKYKKDKTVSISVQFCHSTEQPLINKLQKQSNKSGYVKKLIRKDIESDYLCQKNKRGCEKSKL